MHAARRPKGRWDAPDCLPKAVVQGLRDNIAIRIETQPGRAFGMSDSVGDGQRAKENQCGDLNRVDRNIDVGRTIHSAKRDVETP